jgi:hypothetical protein
MTHKRTSLLTALAAVLISVLVGPIYAVGIPVDDDTLAPETAAIVPEAEAIDPAEMWGIEITSIRLTANDHMIDYRYRVVDSDKATDLFKRQIKPFLIHQRTEQVLAVPETAKLGPLRNSNMPQKDRIYWMFFGNAGKLVKTGDKVTVVIGDFRVEDLIVQ